MLCCCIPSLGGNRVIVGGATGAIVSSFEDLIRNAEKSDEKYERCSLYNVHSEAETAINNNNIRALSSPETPSKTLDVGDCGFLSFSDILTIYL